MALRDRFLIIDCETTGITDDSEVLEISVIDNRGAVLLHTYVTPERHSRWPKAQETNKIDPAYIFAGNFPKLRHVLPVLSVLVQGQQVFAYGADFERKFVGDALAGAGEVICAMDAFAAEYEEWDERRNWYKRKKLSTAAAYVLHEWKGNPHGSTADCLATLDVVRYCFDPQFQQAVKDRKAELRAKEAEEDQERALQIQADVILWEWGSKEARRLEKLNEAFTKRFFRVAGIIPHVYGDMQAMQSADAFCRHLTGFPLRVWQVWGEDLLTLPIYNRRRRPPADLVRLETVTWLEKVEHCAFWHKGGEDHEDYVPMYPAGLVVGTHYVPRTNSKPAGAYSKTELFRAHGVKPDELEKLRKVAHCYHAQANKYYFVYEYPPAAQAEPAGGDQAEGGKEVAV